MPLLPHSTTFFRPKQLSSLSIHYSNPSCLDTPPAPQAQNQPERDRVPSVIPSRQDSPWPGCCPPPGLPRLPASRAGATSCLEVSVTGATAQPRGCRYLSRELGQDWAGPSEQRRAFLSPRGGLSKRHLTSGQQTSPAFSSKKTFFLLLSPSLFFFPLSPPPAQLGQPPRSDSS